MSDWSNIWQGIGQLGQTKKGMYDPLIDAHRDRGRMWSEGFGRLSETFKGIGAKRWQSREAGKQRDYESGEAGKQRDFAAGESSKGREHETSEREASQIYQANENELNRALKRQEMWQDWNVTTMGWDEARKEAEKDRDHRTALQFSIDNAENERQKQRLQAAADQYDKQLRLQYDQLSQDNEQFKDQMTFDQWRFGAQHGLDRERLDLDWEKFEEQKRAALIGEGLSEREVNARLAQLRYAMEREKAPGKVGVIYDEAIRGVMQDLSEIFLSTDQYGTMLSKSLAELTNDELVHARKVFEARISDYPEYKESLWNIFNAAAGARRSEEPAPIPDISRDEKKEQRTAEQKEAWSLLGDWGKNKFFGGLGASGDITELERYAETPSTSVVDWLREPVLGYTKSDVTKRLQALSDAIPDMIDRGRGVSIRNPDQTTVDKLLEEVTSGNVTTRRIQEIAEEIKRLRPKYK